MMVSWSFLTNHALVLTVLNEQADSTGLQIAQAVGITERAARKIIAELQAAGYLEAERIGRRNRYRIQAHRPLGRLLGGTGERDISVGDFLQVLQGKASQVPTG